MFVNTILLHHETSVMTKCCGHRVRSSPKSTNGCQRKEIQLYMSQYTFNNCMHTPIRTTPPWPSRGSGCSSPAPRAFACLVAQ